MALPTIIQGGMGIAVSGWKLAQVVARAGQLGVVSGTAVSLVLARRLQEGDPDGRMRHALAHFPVPGVASRVLDRYFVPGGKPEDAPYRAVPMATLRPNPAFVELTVAANFVEVFLAKEGHQGVVGINLLEKIRLPTVPALFGAMLAGVDYVLMGAGIPRAIPGVLDRLAKGEPADLKIDVEGAPVEEEHVVSFDPAAFCGGHAPALRRPVFLAIVSSAVLASTLARKASGRVDGFVIEGDTAGGHNAPPRGPLTLDALGQPVYGPRDVPELEKFRALGLPFWLAGSYGRPERLPAALAQGAAGIQVGTAFAFCEESGIRADVKRRVIAASRDGDGARLHRPVGLSHGFPFKVVGLADTLSEPETYAARDRVCDIGLLQRPYRRDDGSVGYRCPSEDPGAFVAKGGSLEETVGRKCICNGLAATAGFSQVRPDGRVEPVLLTSGDDVADVARFLPPGRDTYTATDVLARLLAAIPAAG